MTAMMSPFTNHLDKDTQDEVAGTPSEDASATVLLAEATADYCQQLAEMLKKKESTRPKHQRVKKVLSNPTEAEKDALLPDERHKYQLATEENIRLRAVIQDVTEANKRWQKYNQERQTYMQKLMDTIRDLKRKIREETGNSGSDLAIINPPEIAPEEFVLLQQKCENILEENKRLQKELDESRKKMAQLSNIVSKTKSDNGEHIELLEMQVRAHRDDWEAEREEKKNILKREEKLQEQLNEAKAKIKDLQRDLHRRTFCVCHDRNGMHTEPIISSRHTYPAAAAYNIPPDSKLIPRSASHRSPLYNQYQYAAYEDELATDCASPTPSRKSVESSNGSSTVSKSRTKDSLVCPACKTVFSSGNHTDFLEHFELCQKGAAQ